MSKILITGGSGFIGTNMVEFYLNKNYEVVNIDISKPRNVAHVKYWRQIDICDFSTLASFFDNYRPKYVLHLAAKTDLPLNAELDHYKANTIGVENVVRLCGPDSGIKRVLFGSSMLVNKIGYKPKHLLDYNPDTRYGESKVLGEEIVFENRDKLVEFVIFRPTSIWGEWFGEPYNNFFKHVMRGSFFHPGDKACTKTYGYIGNCAYKIDRLFHSNASLIEGRVFYIGDVPPINISEWAQEIAKEAKVKAPLRIPFIVFKLGCLFGDLVQMIGIGFPLNTRRLRNMTTNQIIDLNETYTIFGNDPFTREQGTKKTLNWLLKNNL